MENDINYCNTGFEELSNDSIIKELEKKLNRKVESLVLIDSGHVNKSFIVKTFEGKLFCKVSPLWYKNSLSREEWCLKKLIQKKIKVPKVIGLISDQNKNAPGHEILILEYVVGQLLCDIPIIKSEHLDEILNTYNCIHSNEIKGFGWLNKSFEGKNNTWLDFLLDIENLNLCYNISEEWSDKINIILNHFYTLSFKEILKGKLLYGDFNLSNFIVTPSKKIYSLDFQNCFSGDPLYDFASIYILFPTYIKRNNFNDLQKKKIILYALRYLLGRISYFIKKKDVNKVDFYKNKFEIIYKDLNSSW